MFHKKNIRSLTLLLSVILSFSYTVVHADENQDQEDVRSRVINLQQNDIWLPWGVSEQKWRVGTLLARLFDSNGKIKRIFLEAIFTGLSDGDILRYDSGSNAFVSTLVELADLAGNSVDSSKIVNNTITENDISDSFVARSALKIPASAYHWIWDLNASPRSMYDAWISVWLVNSSTDNAPISYWSLVNFPSYRSSQDGGAGQLIFPYSQSYTGNGNPMFRVWRYNNAWWAAWKTFLDKDWADTLYIGVWDSISGDLITDGTLDGTEIEDGTVGLADLAGNSVDSLKVLNNSLTQNDLAPNSVGTSEVAGNSLLATDLAANSVWNSELIDNPQVATLWITATTGNWVRFWNSDNYKIHMWDAAEYHYGPVTGYSIKTNMANDSSRGWTWWVAGATPTVAFNTQWNAQFAGTVSGAAPTANAHLTTKEYVDTEVSTAWGWTKTGADIYRNWGKVWIGTSWPVTEDFEVHGDAMLLQDTSAQVFFNQTFQNNAWDNDWMVETWWDGLVFYEGVYDSTQTTTNPRKMRFNANNWWGAWADEVLRMINWRVGIQVDSWNVNYTLHVNGTAWKTGWGSWSNSSDIRLKDVQWDYEYGLDEVVGLNPIRFNYKDENARWLDTTTNEVWFVAQEVAKLIPDAVTEWDDWYLDFNMHSINVALVNAVKELSEKNDALEKDIQEIKMLLQQ